MFLRFVCLLLILLMQLKGHATEKRTIQSSDSFILKTLLEFTLLEDHLKSHHLEDLTEFHQLEDVTEFHLFEDLFEFHLLEDLCEFHELEDLCEFHRFEDLFEFHWFEDLTEFHQFEDLSEFHLIEDLFEFHFFEDFSEFHFLEDHSEFHFLEDLSEFHLLEDLNEFHIEECPCKVCLLKTLCKLYWISKFIKFVNDEKSSKTEQNPPVDLEANYSDFILETHQIEIPGHREAYNPSVVRWNNSILMCFRARRQLSRLPDQIGFVFLNESLEPTGDPSLLDLRISNSGVPSKPQDPRLVTIGDQLWMVFSDKFTPLLRRMYIAQVHFDGTHFYTEEPVCLSEFENESKTRWEKNWVPFIYQNELLLAYSIQPHHIMLPIREGKCLTFAKTPSNFSWKWGPIHGGTPALLIDGQYLSFFQSHTKMASQQSNGKLMPHYFMGAYTFEATPPFAITAASQEPIVGRNFYNGPACVTWKPMRVVFPTGYLDEEDLLWLFYGRQDNEIWRAKIDKKGLLKSLRPVIPAVSSE